MDPEKKSLNFIFPIKYYVIQKSLKFSHWLSEKMESEKTTQNEKEQHLNQTSITLGSTKDYPLVWNMPMFNRKYTFKGSIFHCYVSLPEGSFRGETLWKFDKWKFNMEIQPHPYDPCMVYTYIYQPNVGKYTKPACYGNGGK